MRQSGENAGELVSSCIWMLNVGKHEQQANNALVSYGAKLLFLLARRVTDTGLFSMMRVLIALNIDGSLVKTEKRLHRVCLNHETQLASRVDC